MADKDPTIRCMVVDDEPLAISLLSDYIGKIPFFSLAEATSDPLKALEVARKGMVDLIFLDMQMPELTGLQFMKVLQRRCGVIITTAYSEYALAGYEHDVIDYLLKPITLDRFMIAAEKSREVLQAREPVHNPAIVQTDIQHIFVKIEHRIVRVDLQDILYLEGARDYVIIHMENEKIMTLQSMKTLEEMLPENKFLRIHKSYVVSIAKIRFIERSRIAIKEEMLPISDTYREKVMAAFKK